MEMPDWWGAEGGGALTAETLRWGLSQCRRRACSPRQKASPRESPTVVISAVVSASIHNEKGPATVEDVSCVSLPGALAAHCDNVAKRALISRSPLPRRCRAAVAASEGLGATPGG